VKLPHRVKIKSKVEYEIVSVEAFPDPKVVGECRFHTNQIAIKAGQSDKQTLMCLIHEILHSAEDAYDINISHDAVYKLEKAIYYILFNNDWSKLK